MTTSISVRGDISLSFTTPTGLVNYTQEGIVSFIGATTDDCGDALAAGVYYTANITDTDEFICNNTSQVGANAFTCDYTTNTNTTSGYYNTSMFANASIITTTL